MLFIGYIINYYLNMTTQHFSLLFSEHKNELFLFCKKLTQSHPKAEDLLQIAALKGFLNRADLTSDDQFKSWMSTIVYNCFLSNYRKKKRRRKLLEEKGTHESLFFNRTTTKNKGYERLKAEDIHNLTASLSKSKYETFKLYLNGFSYKEITEHLGIAMGTVKSRIYSVRKKMKESEFSLVSAA